jgi:4-amino-4-deoxy-L-arabinose transferase-like glycosyltransferase
MVQEFDMSTASPNQPPRDAMRIQLIGATALLFAALLTLLLGLNMRRELNHDEHQFIASAALIARDGLTPYVDFPYFHVPVLSYLYALLFRLFDSLLLSARLLSVLFGWATLALLFWLGWRRYRGAQPWLRWWYAALAALWLAALPPFTYTSGRAWNHDAPLFLLLAAFLIHSHTLSDRRSPSWLLLISGLLMGVAAATRLSFGLTAIAFGLIIWLTTGQSLWERLLNSLIFSGGFLLGVSPAVILFSKDPIAFIFDNVGYVRLNTQYYHSVGATGAMTIPGKLAYLGAQLAAEPTALATFVALAIGLWPLRTLLLRGTPPSAEAENEAAITPVEKSHLRFRLWFLGLTLLFTLVGALGATPSQPQYFYPLFPLAMIGIVEAFAAWPAHLQPGVIYTYGLAAITAILVALSVYAPGLEIVFHPGEWFPAKTHAYGQFIRELTGDGNVLTLAPIYVVEGDAAIYPEFATGPFAWRVAPLMSEADRMRYDIIGPDDLDAFLAASPPRAVLTGVENDDADEEAPLVQYTQDHSFVPVELPDESILHLSPLAKWAETIQLGGHTLPDRPLQPGDSFLLTLYLQSLRTMDVNFNLLIRAIDADGNELLRADGWPFGSPTSQWTPGAVWADGHEFAIPPAAKEGYYRVTVSFYDPATLDELDSPAEIGYLLVQDPNAAQRSDEEIARFGDLLALEEAAASLETSDVGETIAVEVTWRAMAPMSQDYVVSVQVLDDADQLIAQSDAPPLAGFLPTSALDPALPVQDAISVPLPRRTPSGDYRVIVSVYDSATLDRLPVFVDGASIGDAFIVGEVTFN